MNFLENIRENALNNFQQETGISAEWRQIDGEYDGEVTLIRKKERLHFYVEVKRDLRLYQLDKIMDLAGRRKPFMVIADNILNNVKEKLKEQGIAYIDGNGNAYINEGRALIMIDAKKNLPEQKAFKPVTNRAFTKTGLKVVFHFLLNPTTLEKTYREIAQNTGVALGNVKYILDGLREAGFLIQVAKNEVKLQNKKVLLDRWIAGYRETLRPALLLGTFSFFDAERYDQWQSIPTKELDMLWGGEPAAELITGYIKAKNLTIYTNKAKGWLMTGLKLAPRQNGDIQAYEKFWKQHENKQQEYVPMMLVYADLLITDDPRCIETAKIIFDKYLKHELGTD